MTDKKKEVPNFVTKFIKKNFKSMDEFKQQFTQKASTIFGIGWCYLTMTKNGSISINQYSNAGNPMKEDGEPLLCIDAWEHAWYIDYENRKGEYFKNYLDAVNWDFLEKRIKETKII